VIALLFPGQGSQKVGMGRALAETFPVCRDTFAEADAALGEPLSRLCFEGPEQQLTLTENTQPAILTVSVAACRLLAAHGVRPAFVAGHSLGEYSANVAAGTMRFEDAVTIVRRRGRYMQEAVPNGAGQVVIAGSAAAVARAGERAKARGAKRVLPLPVSAPFHCALMKPAEERLAPELRALAVQDPRVPIVANVDAEPKRSAAEAIEALIAQVSSPVRWEAVIGRLASEGVTTYVEVGPGTVLSGLVRKIHRGASVVSFGAPDDLAAVEGLL
jgi:[acyl-carrier-protein] S-malonyltransferase